MARTKTKRPRKTTVDQREQCLAIFADYAEHNVDRLFDFISHCGIDLEPMRSDKSMGLDDVIAAHFYIRPGVYDIARLGDLFATFPPIAARIAEIKAERAAQGLA